MVESFPTPVGIPSDSWRRLCADVLALPAAYRYARAVWGTYQRVRASGNVAEAEKIRVALMAYLDALGEFVSKASDGLIVGAREGKISPASFYAWRSGVEREAKSVTDAMGGRGLGLEPLTLLTVAVCLVVVSVAYGLMYSWRKLSERRYAVDAAVENANRLGIPLSPEIVNPPADPWVRVDGGAALSGGVLVGLGVVVYLLTRRGR